MSGSNLQGSRVFSDYSLMTVLQLKTRLRELEIRFLSKDRKAQLISLLQNYDAVNASSTQSLENNNNEDQEDEQEQEQEEEEEEEEEGEEEEAEVDPDNPLGFSQEDIQFLIVRKLEREGKTEEEIVDFLDEHFYQ